jgi:Phage portal protein, SPP1 Gp6-like
MAKLFDTGGQYPAPDHIERIARYIRNEKIFEGRQAEIVDRASKLLKRAPGEDNTRKEQIESLYIAVNLMDVILTKPADLMVGEEPTYDSGKPDASKEQQALNRIVEENDLNKVIHEAVIGAGVRGDAFLKVYHDYRQDFSEVPEGFSLPPTVRPEPIIEAIDPKIVFPETSRGSDKRFKAVNIAWVEYIDPATGAPKSANEKRDRTFLDILKEMFDKDAGEIPILHVERHVPGFIIYEAYRLYERDVDTSYGAPVQIFDIGEQLPTGREFDIEPTGVPRILIEHIPYKATDTSWQGISGIEKLDSVLAAINDRLVQIDYILHKHSDPTLYGPPLDDGAGGNVRLGGAYIDVTKDDATPGAITWDSKLEGAFRELDYLIGLVFMLSETPQWLFGTTLSEDKGGTGTSHTDGVAIKARFMPILSKVKRIRLHVDKAIRTILWNAMELENFAHQGVAGFEHYEPVFPKIVWKDGIPANEKELAEIMAIRTGNKPTLDVKSAIKRMDEVDDEKAAKIAKAIEEDEQADAVVDPMALVNPPLEEAPEEEEELDGGDE